MSDDINNKISASRAISERDLYYWMGKVDSQLQNLQIMMEKLIDTDKGKWSEIKSWQAGVDKQLQSGIRHFAILDSKVDRNSNDIKEIECALKEHEGDNGNSGKGSNGSKYVSWPWLLEKILVPVIVWGIIILLGLAAANALPLP